MSAQRSTRSRRAAVPAAPARPPLWHRPEAGVGAAVFLAGFLARVLFARATPDRGWPHGVFFKGDAGLWVESARARLAGVPFELGLPIHPPGTAFLLEALWDGRDAGLAGLKIVWALLGAVVVLLVYAAVLRSFGLAAAALTAVFCAASTGLLILSTSLDSETPYLVLAAATLALFESIRAGPRGAALAGWSVLHGLACLFRVEHVLFYGLYLALLVVLWARAGSGAAHRPRAIAGRLALSVLFFALPLVPWHAAAWSSVEAFNTEVPTDPSQEGVRRVTASLAWMPWDPAAAAERGRWPAFARDAASAFVAATVLERGGARVGTEDLRILDDAFGFRPRPLGRFPFVSLYGPLNFALANHPRANGGFTRAALEDPPPLAGGRARYPPALVAGLPPPDLSFVYPPHLRLVDDGYRIGWRWLAERGLGGAAVHLGRKLRLFWSGTALGLTGWDLPLGLPRLRRAVDIAVPEPGWRTAGWSALLLLASATGLAAAWRDPALHPWLLFLLSKVLVTVAFFGYARHGVVAFPVVALLAALAAVRWVPRLARSAPRDVARATVLALLAVVALEGARAAWPPALTVDGRPLDAGDTADVHRDQRIDAR